MTAMGGGERILRRQNRANAGRDGLLPNAEVNETGYFSVGEQPGQTVFNRPDRLDRSVKD